MVKSLLQTRLLSHQIRHIGIEEVTTQTRNRFGYDGNLYKKNDQVNRRGLRDYANEFCRKHYTKILEHQN